MGEQTQIDWEKVESIATHGGLEGFKSVQSVSFSHGFACSNIFKVQILQPENDVSSGKDTFCSLFSFFFRLLITFLYLDMRK